MHRDNETTARARPYEQVLTIVFPQTVRNMLQTTRVHNDIKVPQNLGRSTGVGLPEFKTRLAGMFLTGLLNDMVRNVNGCNLQRALREPRSRSAQAAPDLQHRRAGRQPSTLEA